MHIDSKKYRRVPVPPSDFPRETVCGEHFDTNMPAVAYLPLVSGSMELQYFYDPQARIYKDDGNGNFIGLDIKVDYKTGLFTGIKEHMLISYDYANEDWDSKVNVLEIVK